jgi:hypothetical protein
MYISRARRKGAKKPLERASALLLREISFSGKLDVSTNQGRIDDEDGILKTRSFYSGSVRSRWAGH